MLAGKIKHDIPSHLINRVANSAVGGASAMAKELGVSTSLIQKQAEEPPNDENDLLSGVRNDLDRIERKMIALANSGYPDIAMLYLKYLLEVFDGILQEKLSRKIDSIQEHKNGDNKGWMRFVTACRHLVSIFIA